MNNDIDRLKSGILGFIIGDVMGVPLEFKDRKHFKENKVIDMLEYGSHNMPKGSWSDDSSMVIATMKSIIDNNGNIDYIDIMNNFMKWAENGEFTPNDKTFGIGRTTLNALKCYRYRNEFKEYENPINCGQKDFRDNGNGSLMRILPISFYCYYKKLNDDEIYDLVRNISSLTHSHQLSILGCFIYTLFIINLLKENNKEYSYKEIRNYNYNKYFDLDSINYYKRLLDNDISKLDIDNISSLGFVVDTLEAVIWSFMNSNNYDESIINAINLGNDSDTIGALVGGLSGIYYENLNKEWSNNILRKDYIEDLCFKYINCLEIKTDK
ncbi:MAG: ADP-ribosylglycohydrolase family protein [Bacilli bacterium]|nr:ADP-ribosylglycohydrolase family protein [Bacilli bacterium]